MGTLLKKNIYASYVVQIFNIGVNFTYSLVIVHLLGASAYGAYSVFFNSIVFAALLFGFNLPSVIIFFITNKRIDAGKLLFSSLVFTFIATAILVFVLSLSGYLKIAVHIFPGGDTKPLWIFFFSAMFLLLQVNQVLQAFLNAHKIFIPIAVFSLVCNALLLFFWIFSAFKLITLDILLFNTIWWLSIFINTAICGYTVYLVIKKTSMNGFWQFINPREFKMVAGFALIVYACNTLQFLNYKMDIWFVNFYRSSEEAGVYALSLSLAQLIWILPNAVSAVLLNYYEVEQKQRSILTALNYARFCLYASIFSAAALLAIYYLAIPYFYGQQFSNTFALCVLLFIGVVPFSLSIIIANLNSGIGFVKINLYATLFTFVLGCILDIILIPRYGMEGAAIAKVVIYILGLVFQVIAGHILYQLPWRSMFRFPDWRKLMRSN